MRVVSAVRKQQDDGTRILLKIWADRGNPIIWVRIWNLVGFGIGRTEGQGWPHPIAWRKRV